MARRLFVLLVPLVALLAGCDQLGIESASVTAARQEADGKAVGGACRHAGRAIEDCFALNRRVDKAAIYAGWREMDDYMRENKEAVVAPVLAPGGGRQAGADAGSGDDAGAKTAQSDAKPDARADAKPEGKGERGAKGEKSSRADESAKADKSAKADDAGKAEKLAARDGGEAADKGAAAH
jgi:hypothetical protein